MNVTQKEGEGMVITRDDSIPMYVQIADILKEKIQHGEIKPGERLGTQQELADTFRVSKITIRQAIQQLRDQNLVITRQGKGTFVKPQKVEQELIRLQSLTEIIEESGYDPAVEILNFERVSTPDDMKGFGAECLYIERLHSVDNKPIAYAEIHLPYYIGEILTKDDFNNHTVYHLLEHKIGTKLGEALQTIEACPAAAKQAKQLAVPKGTPMLKLERVTYDTNHASVEKIVFYYRYDAITLKVRLPSANQVSMWSIEPTQ